MQPVLTGSNNFLHLCVSNIGEKRYPPGAADATPSGKLFAPQMIHKPCPAEAQGQEHTKTHPVSSFGFNILTAQPSGSILGNSALKF